MNVQFGAIYVGSKAIDTEYRRRFSENNNPDEYLMQLTGDENIMMKSSNLPVDENSDPMRSKPFQQGVLPDGRLMVVTNKDTPDLDDFWRFCDNIAEVSRLSPEYLPPEGYTWGISWTTVMEAQLMSAELEGKTIHLLA